VSLVVVCCAFALFTPPCVRETPVWYVKGINQRRVCWSNDMRSCVIVTLAREPVHMSNVDWHAAVKKDRHCDGKFVYPAVTTRIYCHPSCLARNPHRRNTLIFLTPAGAERQVYISCLRCHPNSLTPAERSIKPALGYIEAHLDQTITLNTLSQVSGLSQHYLQETFNRIIGLLPKDFFVMGGAS